MPIKKANAQYFIIAQRLREKVVERKAGSSFLSIREVASSYDCSLHTANRAIKLLVEEGWLRSRQGSGIVVAKRLSPPRAMLFIPDWSYAEEIYGARMLYAASDALAKIKWEVEPSIGFSLQNLASRVEALLPRDSSAEASGDVHLYGLAANLPEHHHWALEGVIDESQALIEEEQLRLVSTHRRHPSWRWPAVLDDFEAGFRELLVALRARGIRRLVVVARDRRDGCYEEVLQCLLALLPEFDMSFSEEDLFRDDGLNLEKLRAYKRPRDFSAQCCVLSFTPNALFELQHWWDGFQDDAPMSGCLSIKSVTPFPKVDFVLESRLNDHARSAVALLKRWQETNKRPKDQHIPMDLIWF